ncbi:MAG: sensor histidine kinase [Anaerolineae bacterium]|nr:sensor histidine kinase [Anaerolineae bacterium]
MRELALHILDIVENAIMAHARRIELFVIEDWDADLLTLRVQDDGCGMDVETVRRVRDPFYTTRTTRHVGLGIPLLAAAAGRCAGRLDIESAPGQGTTIVATFRHSHIDRAPLGDMTSTLIGILMRGEPFDLRYTHRVQGSRTSPKTFEFDTAELKLELGDVPLTYPDVREWLREFIAEGEQELTREP